MWGLRERIVTILALDREALTATYRYHHSPAVTGAGLAEEGEMNRKFRAP